MSADRQAALVELVLSLHCALGPAHFTALVAAAQGTATPDQLDALLRMPAVADALSTNH